jgi:O-antigen/teichoic acid export membrane protein
MIWDENYRGVSMANDKTWRFSLVDLATKVLFISGLLATIFVPEFRTIYYYATLSIITYSLGFVIDYFTFKKSVTVGRFRLPLLRAILPVMGYLGLTMLLKSVYLTTDSFVLAWTGAEDGVINGYTESYKLMEVFMIAPALVMPSIASKWKKSQRVQAATKVKQDFFRTLMLSLVLGVILYLVIIILGPLALGVIQLNNTYASAFVALPILGVSLIVFFAQTYLRHVLVLENLEKSELLANLITAILSICIYALIIPRFGFIGASWSTVAVFFVLTLLRLGFAIRHLRVLD